MSYQTEFPADCHPPRAWIAAIEAQGARDDSWRNDAAPSWSMPSGPNHVTRFFYYTPDNGGFDEGAHVMIVTEFHARPEAVYVCSPAAALILARWIRVGNPFHDALKIASGYHKFTAEE